MKFSESGLPIKIRPVDHILEEKIQKNWDKVAKPLDGLGRFEKMTARIGAILGTEQIDLSQKAVIVMCADNGVVEEGISQSGQEVTAMIAKSLGEGNSSVCKMAAAAGAKVIPVDIGVNTTEKYPGVLQRKVAMGTGNFAKEPAMTEEQALAAIRTGMELVRECKEQGIRLLGTGEMGIGNTTTSSAMAAALLHCVPEKVTGRGAGLSNQGLQRKKEIIQAALDDYQLWDADAFQILCTVGGLDIAGLTGVFIGGAVYGLPIVLDGVISGVAALTAERLCPGVREYMLASHVGKEPAAALILKELQLSAVIHGELALGEGTGTTMLFALLDMAMTLYQQGMEFQEIQLKPYERFV